MTWTQVLCYAVLGLCGGDQQVMGTWHGHPWMGHWSSLLCFKQVLIPLSVTKSRLLKMAPVG
jgi:hypothetical protein